MCMTQFGWIATQTYFRVEPVYEEDNVSRFRPTSNDLVGTASDGPDLTDRPKRLLLGL
jgi:hypothetical protein